MVETTDAGAERVYEINHVWSKRVTACEVETLETRGGEEELVEASVCDAGETACVERDETGAGWAGGQGVERGIGEEAAAEDVEGGERREGGGDGGECGVGELLAGPDVELGEAWQPAKEVCQPGVGHAGEAVEGEGGELGTPVGEEGEGIVANLCAPVEVERGESGHPGGHARDPHVGDLVAQIEVQATEVGAGTRDGVDPGIRHAPAPREIQLLQLGERMCNHHEPRVGHILARRKTQGPQRARHAGRACQRSQPQVRRPLPRRNNLCHPPKLHPPPQHRLAAQRLEPTRDAPQPAQLVQPQVLEHLHHHLQRNHSQRPQPTILSVPIPIPTLAAPQV